MQSWQPARPASSPSEQTDRQTPGRGDSKLSECPSLLTELPFLALWPRQDSHVISFLLTAEVAEACIVPMSRQLLYRSPPALRTELDPRHSG
ncbi:Rho Family-Interacting Cell Polarization Regulator 2 [Manis pentadactyla]|nr:Rho Family-Interacting Cell Polarization Regulator 2 [Manis pentadactyla]